MIISQGDWNEKIKDWNKIYNIKEDLVYIKPNDITYTIGVTIPKAEYEKLKQDSETLARIKEYVNNLDKE